MNKKQTLSFASRHSHKKVFIKFVWEKNDKSIRHAIAYVKNIPDMMLITINRNAWNKFSDIRQKSFILHEIGHGRDGAISKSDSTEEYMAQIWAIKYARANRMSKIEQELIFDTFDWLSSPPTRYLKIYKIAARRIIRELCSSDFLKRGKG